MITPGMYPFSDLCYLFPKMTPEEKGALGESIGTVGLRDRIAVYQKQIVDGRHRYEAGSEIGFEFEERHFVHLPEDTDPVRFVLDKNVVRRHLTTGQRAYIAHQLSRLSTHGGDRRSPDQAEKMRVGPGDGGFTQADAARLLGVSERTVSQAARVFKEGGTTPPELREAVETDLVSVSDAARVAGKPANILRRALQAVQEGTAKTLTSAVHVILQEDDSILVPPSVTPGPPVRLYPTIVVDPPWPAGPFVPEEVSDRENGRQPMTIDQIGRMDLPLTDDGFVFLWTPQDRMPDAFGIIRRWGLDYRFTLVWRKPGGIRPPNSCRFDIEFVVVGSRGNPQFPDNSPIISSTFAANCPDPLAPHSAKPQVFYDIFSGVTAKPRLELPEGGTRHFRD